MSDVPTNAFSDLVEGAQPTAVASAPAQPNAFADTIPPQQAKKAADEQTLVGQANRAAGLTERALITGATALPGMVMDAGVAARNLIGDAFHRAMGQPATPDYSLPYSQDFQGWLTNQGGMPEPQGFGEKGASALLGGLAGGPAGGGVTNPAPAQFVAPATARAQAMAASLARLQAQGLKVPPSTTNPTLANRTIESVAGKDNVQNFARIDNDAGRTAIGAQAIGLKPEVMTPDAVAAVKKEAGQAWDAGRAIPRFKTSDAYLDALAKVEAENTGANASFPGAANPDVGKIIDTYTQGSMTGDAGVSAVKLLRSKASDAFSSGNSELGRTYKGVAQAIEDELERAAQDPRNGVKPNVISQIRQARQTYAKASLIQDSMLPDGTVSGPKLAAAWRNDEPMTGPLRDAAEFAAQYPKANLSASASGSPVNHLSMWGALLGSGVGEHLGQSAGHAGLGTALGVAAIPAARAAARNYLLSGAGQRGALPGAGVKIGLTPQQLASGLAAFQPGAQ
jgi:hypothetical protein